MWNWEERAQPAPVFPAGSIPFLWGLGVSCGHLGGLPHLLKRPTGEMGAKGARHLFGARNQSEAQGFGRGDTATAKEAVLCSGQMGTQFLQHADCLVRARLGPSSTVGFSPR